MDENQSVLTQLFVSSNHNLQGGQFRAKTRSLFEANLGGHIRAKITFTTTHFTGGQFRAKTGGQFDRIFQLIDLGLNFEQVEAL
jgi:hypothetical protein